MEKRRLIRLVVWVVLFAVIAAALVLWWENREVPLVERYPVVARGKYVAALMWDGEEPGQSVETGVSSEEFQQILGTAKVKKRAKTQAAPEVEFFIRLYDESSVVYSIELGKDRSITVARLDDLEKSRTYWTDCEGDVFAKLYDCHLKHGGAPAP